MQRDPGQGPKAIGAVLRVGRLALIAGLAALGAAPSAGAAPRPNVIVFELDDQPASFVDHGAMPVVSELVGAGGATFTDSVATTPLCCPSRASLLTGQYGHNHGVLSNRPGYGALAGKRDVLPAWLRSEGYRTAHVGKWLHGYAAHTGDTTETPPGWDEWRSIVLAGGRGPRYYDYHLMVNGERVHYGTKPEDHLTRVLTDHSVRMIRRYVPRRKPLYLQVDHFAPHASGRSTAPCQKSAEPEPQERGLFARFDLPEPPSFNEADVSDKNKSVQFRSLLDEAAITDLERKFRCALEASASADREFERIFNAVQNAGELNRTAFIYTADNGYAWGEHRLVGKSFPYEEQAKVPLMIRVPAAWREDQPPGATISEPVANIDLAPTILELARARPCVRSGCRVLDGRSLLPLLRGDEHLWPNQRAIGIELGHRTEAHDVPPKFLCSYRAVRVGGELFARFAVGEVAGDPCPNIDQFFPEHYDLGTDPFQLENSWPGLPSPQQDALADRLERIKDCAGIAGRDPQPQSGHYCE